MWAEMFDVCMYMCYIHTYMYACMWEAYIHTYMHVYVLHVTLWRTFVVVHVCMYYMYALIWVKYTSHSQQSMGILVVFVYMCMHACVVYMHIWSYACT